MPAPAKLSRFDEAILPHLDAAYNLARWLMRNNADAEDAVQDACLRAIRFISGLRGGDGRMWLLAIVPQYLLLAPQAGEDTRNGK